MLRETQNVSEEQKRIVTKSIVPDANIVSKGNKLLKVRRLKGNRC